MKGSRMEGYVCNCGSMAKWKHMHYLGWWERPKGKCDIAETFLQATNKGMVMRWKLCYLYAEKQMNKEVPSFVDALGLEQSQYQKELYIWMHLQMCLTDNIC